MKGRFVLLFICMGTMMFAQTRDIILDADTGNEVDDLYAIVRALIEPGWDINTLNATQWQSSQWATDNTMEDSHRLNQALVGYLQMEREVRTLRGGVRRMYDWGKKAQHSEAAYEIIKQAHMQPEGEKQWVIVLGALTNVASALEIDPSIESKIIVYWLGTRYDFEKKSHKRIDFNAIMDPQACEIMLSSRVEMHIIPGNVSAVMRFDYQETSRRFKNVHPLTDFLFRRWDQAVEGERYARTIWDLGLVGAMIHPEWTTEVKGAGFENPNIWLYKEIKAELIIQEFFETTLDYVAELPGY